MTVVEQRLIYYYHAHGIISERDRFVYKPLQSTTHCKLE